MQFDLSTVETATMVFFGTVAVALVVALFLMTAAFAALVMVGIGRLAWIIAAGIMVGLVHRAGRLWVRLVRQASAVELAGDFRGELRTGHHGQNSAPSSGTYPRVALRDS